MRRAVIGSLGIVIGCGVPVDVGMLDGSTGGSTTTDSDASFTATDGMTGPGPTSEPMTESSSEGDDPPPTVEHAFAIRFGDLPDVGSESETGGSSASTSASSTTTGETDSGGGSDADALLIRATTGLATCEDPFGIEPCPATWTYGFKLPLELQFVGAAGRLEDVDGFMAEVGGAPVDCSFGGGSLFGNYEITAIDATHVAGRMFDLELTMWETEVDFDAPKCGG